MPNSEIKTLTVGLTPYDIKDARAIASIQKDPSTGKVTMTTRDGVTSELPVSSLPTTPNQTIVTSNGNVSWQDEIQYFNSYSDFETALPNLPVGRLIAVH